MKSLLRRWCHRDTPDELTFHFRRGDSEHSDDKAETRNLQLHARALCKGQFRENHILGFSFCFTFLIQESQESSDHTAGFHGPSFMNGSEWGWL
jgi:hypothetical protein